MKVLAVLNDKGEYRLLAADDILYMLSDGEGGLLLRTYDETFRLVLKVREFADYLGERGFFRLDRGTLANVRRAEGYDSKLNLVRMKTNAGDVLLPASESRRKELRELFPPDRV